MRLRRLIALCHCARGAARCADGLAIVKAERGILEAEIVVGEDTYRRSKAVTRAGVPIYEVVTE